MDPKPRSSWLNALGSLALLALFAAAALAFAWPWLPRPLPGGTSLARYAPLHDGDTALFARSDAQGRTFAWVSRNVVVVPALRAVTDLRAAQYDSLKAFLLRPGETTLSDTDVIARLSDVQVTELREREVDASDGITDTVSFFLRDARGEFEFGLYLPGPDQDLRVDPPVVSFPADMLVGRNWESSGKVGVVSYTSTAQMKEATSFQGKLGTFDDCVRVDSQLRIGSAAASLPTTTTEVLCSGIGAVSSDTTDPAGTRTHDTLLATRAVLGDASALPMRTVTVSPALPLAADAAWQLSRVGRTRPTGDSADSTVPPVWVAGDSPLLLAAAYNGDLVAFDAGAALGTERWRFHTEGTIFGTPAVDAARGRIYVGSSDKHLYALDTRGVFLWAFTAGDNIASRPLIMSDTVVFGSEDRSVYALDAGSGALRWSAQTGGSVVPAPAAAGALAVVGSDDGGIYAFALANGGQVWQYAMDGAVEAPVVVSGGVAFAASRGGLLSAIGAGDGAQIWSRNVGSALRTAPVLGEQLLFIVSEDGTLYALNRADGRQVWAVANRQLVGPPVLAGQTVIAASATGDVYRFSLDGGAQGQWSGLSAQSVADHPSHYAFGPTTGGGALWLADSDAVVRRLGPALSGPLTLKLAWAATIEKPPFELYPLQLTPAAYGSQAVILDSNRSIYLVDAATGKSQKLGSLPGTRSPAGEPVVSGDVLLVSTGDALHATRLTDGKQLWQFDAEGLGLRGPVVAGDTVLWIAQQIGESQTNGGALYALDLATGALRWRALVSGVGALGGIEVRDGAVYIATPPAAYDLATGQQRWRSLLPAVTYGAPLLSPSGDALLVAALGSDGNSGAILALNSANGGLRWRADLAGDYLPLLLDNMLATTDTLAVPLNSGSISGRDITTGAERWRYKPDKPLYSHLTLAQDRLWFVLSDARLIVLDARSGKPVAQAHDIDLNLGSARTGAARPVTIGQYLLAPVGAALLGIQLVR